MFISWFEGGEVFRSGVTFQRGAGKILYFRPGHEAYPTYHNPLVLKVIRNATRWAYSPAEPWTARSKTRRMCHMTRRRCRSTVKGPRLHEDGEEGYR